ncbi:MAG: 4Fe-4S binding protein [Desulfurococcales archaeon]|nr:4Fe-4S binding protein [Desulfurococcales archaeon]
MTVIASKEVVERFGPFPEGLDVKAVDGNVRELVLDRVLSGMPVVGIYRGAFKEYPGIHRLVRSEGGNPYLYEPLDTLYMEVLPRSLARLLPGARLEAVMASKPWKMEYRVNASKSVTRRTLLLRPQRAIREYVPAPIMVNYQACAIVPRCTRCVERCPENALVGKPPSLAIDRCTWCGICVHECPFNVLTMPRWGPYRVERVLSYIRRYYDGPLRLLVMEIDELKGLEYPDEATPFIVEIVDDLGWIDEKTLITGLTYGVDTIIYDPRGKLAEDPHLNRLARIAASRKELSRELRRQGLPEGGYAPDAAPARAIALLGLERLETRTPVLGVIEVNENCTLCDACVVNCPTGALEKRIEDSRITLVFRHSKCVSCEACLKVCPHDAIEVSFSVDTRLYGREVVVAEDKLVRCRVCGKPLGPRRMFLKVEEVMRSRGLPERAIKAIYLCDECRERMLRPRFQSPA